MVRLPNPGSMVEIMGYLHEKDHRLLNPHSPAADQDPLAAWQYDCELVSRMGFCFPGMRCVDHIEFDGLVDRLNLLGDLERISTWSDRTPNSQILSFAF